MKRLALLLTLAFAATAQAGVTHLDAPAQTLYVRIFTSGTASFAVALTEGTSNAVGRYTVSDAAILSAAGGTLAANTTPGYFGKVFIGTPSTSANDTWLGSFVLPWDGDSEVGANDEVLEAIAEIEGGTPISPDIISKERTWVAINYRATNIVEVAQGFVGTFALKPDLNNATTINSVSAVSITGAATVTATDLSVDRSRTMAHFTVPALSTTGTYNVAVTVTTVDGQTIVTRGTLKVE